MIVNPWHAGVLGKIGPYFPCGRVERSLGKAIACGLISILKLLLSQSRSPANPPSLIFENYSNCARSNTGIFDRVSQYRERSRTAVRTPLACYQKPDQVQR